MLTDKFSVEETNLICIFDTGNKTALIADLQASLPDIYDPDMREIYESTLAKLESLTDAEFAEIGFYIADDTIDETEV